MGERDSNVEVTNWRLDSWYPNLTADTRMKMKLMYDEIYKFNNSLSLVSFKTLQVADAIHFSDSILASEFIYKDAVGATEIFDFGSGNGFPGVIFAILYPEVKVVLVDNDAKKCEFLKHLVDTLKIKNVQILSSSVESLPEGSVKYCMTRAMSSISKSIFLARKSVVSGGSFYHLKGEGWAQEVTEIPSQLCSFWAPGLLAEYKLPIGSMKFSVIKTAKIK